MKIHRFRPLSFLMILLALGLVLTGLGVPGLASAEAAPSSPRARMDLNGAWRFTLSDPAGAHAEAFADRAWEEVTVPHTWNAVDGADGGNPGVEAYHRGVGWYRRNVQVPASMAGQQIFLQFAGANQVADVYVNGVHLGQHIGGYSRFRFNATQALRVGADNVIAVRVDNAHNPDIAPLQADFSFSGGIYRNVSLWAVNPLQIRMLDDAGPGVTLAQRSVTAARADVDVKTTLWNNHATPRAAKVRVRVADASGRDVATATTDDMRIEPGTIHPVELPVSVQRPRRWQGTVDPYLYSATVEVVENGVVVDAVTEPLGLRTIEITADRGLLLNGVPTPLRGVNLHQDRGPEGWAQSNAHHDEDFRIIADMGANAIRMAHYQHDQRDYDLADQYGMLVWAEIPFINRYTDTPAFETNLRRQMRELVKQNINHPSIVVWGIGNEERTDDARTKELLVGLNTLSKELDPTRATTYATCCVSDTAAITDVADTIGYNRYYGWYGNRHPSYLGAWADSLHERRPGYKIAISEYGAGANTTQHTDSLAKPVNDGDWHPEEYQAFFHEESLKAIQARPYIWGTFVWAMFDFASDKRDEGNQPGINDKGLVTRDRKTTKDSYHWYKANWAPSPTLYITSRRWTERTLADTRIKVYTNAERVRATLNGRALPEARVSGRIASWPVTLRPGTNTVRVEATINGAVVSDEVTWNLDLAASSTREAEDHVDSRGVAVAETIGQRGARHVGGIERGDWMAYDVDFGAQAPTTFVVRAASGATVAGRLEVRTGSPTGPVVVSEAMPNTGDWFAFKTRTSPVKASLTGRQRIYITVSGEAGRGVANLDSFRFRR